MSVREMKSFSAELRQTAMKLDHFLHQTASMSQPWWIAGRHIPDLLKANEMLLWAQVRLLEGDRAVSGGDYSTANLEYLDAEQQLNDCDDLVGDIKDFLLANARPPAQE